MELPEQLQQSLGGSYELVRTLGAGGMATVYLAHDLRHGREVALKVLHPDLGSALGPERFQREIRLAARLQHPHILTVLDSGETGGRLWFTMPYVEGESLRDRLERERQLPVADAVRIATQAAQALQYAHSHGVIHRDIKPENLLLTEDGNTLVADFGIARSLAASGSKLTETGVTLGTPAYMSPEQASGEADVSALSDIYSLGTVLYEMLAGEPPFTGPTAQAVIAKRFTSTAPDVRLARPTVPEGVALAVAQALAPVPADRFANAADFARALTSASATTQTAATVSAQNAPASASRSDAAAHPPSSHAFASRSRRPLFAALVLGVAIGLGLLFGWSRNRSGDRPTGVRLVAVLPFENIGDTSAAYFADGITDAVRGKLTSLPGLQVTASSSSGEYRHTTKTSQQIARELGVDYLLIGKVRWAKSADGTSRVQVSPELIKAASASTAWQESFDANLTDVFKVQTDIASRVATALNVALGDSAQRKLVERPTTNLAAYDAFLRGDAASGNMSAVDAVSLRRAAGFYEQATAIDPGFALAWTRLSRAYAGEYANGAPSQDVAELSRQAAERGLELAPERSDGHLALGDYYANVKADFQRAASEYAEGLRRSPSDVDLLTAASLNQQSLGQWDSALVTLTRASKLDPRSIVTGRRLGFTLLRLRRYPEAVAVAERTLALGPDKLALIENRAMIELAKGDLASARSIIAAAETRTDPTALVAQVGNYWDLYWVLDEQQQQLLLRLSPAAFDDDRSTWGIVLAQMYALRGDSLRMRAYADSARVAIEKILVSTPDDAQRRVFHGLALAYLGKRAEAVREGEKAAASLPISKDGYTGPYIQQLLVRIYMLTGDKNKALDHLEPLLKVPYHLSPGWLKIDPTFAPLRSEPRFQKLVSGS
ncbi:MAG TPA: protein kinase [Gemmatimonadaceae bacterium]|nr:protein kinase [Gemmatimonadaceae bacterium]